MPPKQIFDGSLWDEQFHTAKDALKERPPVKYIVETLFRLPSMSLVYGIAGSHKTNLMIDLSVCVALNRAWLKSPEFPGFRVEASPILWVDEDSGMMVLDERFGAALRAHGTKATMDNAPIHYISFPNPDFAATDPAGIGEIIRRVNLWKVKLVIFDNLGMISGGLDENTSQMIHVMRGLRFISERTGAAVIAIHHDPKNDNGGRKTPRGHSSIEGATDLALWIERDEDVFTARATKVRHAKPYPFSAMLQYVHRPGTTEFLTMQFVGVEPETDPTSQKATAVLDKYFKSHTEGTQSELVDLLRKEKIGRNRAYSELNRLVHCNWLKVKSGQLYNRIVYLRTKSSDAPSFPLPGV